MSLIEHFAHNDDRDKELPEEDVAASLLGVIGYAAQSLEFGMPQEKVIKHLRSESLRIKIALEEMQPKAHKPRRNR